jgi:threonine dehydrogenase-like Zn-dependent dehydrogenase
LKTKAVRLYGTNDLRLEEFELPQVQEDELLLRIVSDSLCASTYKAVIQGSTHKRVPDNLNERPVVIGHEMCGNIIEVGDNLKGIWKEGQKVVVQPDLKLPGKPWSIGYSYPNIGGCMTYAIVPKEVLDRECLIPYNGDGYFKGSLAEPLACVLRGYKGMYHIDHDLNFVPGIKKNSRLAILGGAGPMGLGAIDYALNYENASLIVVTDLNAKRLKKAEMAFPVETAKKKGTQLVYQNVSGIDDQAAFFKEKFGRFDDVFIMVPSSELANIGEHILDKDGCLNMFAGPVSHELVGETNLYRVHYDSIHILGTAGSTTEDMKDALEFAGRKVINPAVMVSHILGLDSAAGAIQAMNKNDGLKKICYPSIWLPLTAIEDFEGLGKQNSMFRVLDQIVKEHEGLWCTEAEEYLLEHAPAI